MNYFEGDMDRVKIMQDDRLVGTIPRPGTPPRGDHFQIAAESRTGNPLVDFRVQDFQIGYFDTNNGWCREVRLIADHSLCPGDFEDIVGFQHESD